MSAQSPPADKPPAPAEKPAADKPSGEKPAPPATPAKPAPEEPPVVTRHEIHVGSRTLRYTATVGRMPIKSDQGEPEASIFYVAYTLDGVSDTAKRPLMFSFNGGPGSSSVWLHLGALGPRRVRMVDEVWLAVYAISLVVEVLQRDDRYGVA